MNYFSKLENFSSLEEGCPEGIPFSKCKEYIKKQRGHLKKTKRKKNTNRKKKRSLKRNRVPPKGVVIRKNDKLYRSDGRTLKLI